MPIYSHDTTIEATDGKVRGVFITDVAAAVPLIVTSSSKLFGVPPPSPGPTDLLAPSQVFGVAVAIAGTTNTITFEPSADAWANATGVNDYLVLKDGVQIANPAGDGAINPNFTYLDLGSPGIAGSATIDATGLGWTLKAGGAATNFYGTSDTGGIFYASATTDIALRSKIVSLSAAANFAKTGLMYRASTAANASMVHLNLNYGVNTVSLDVRNGTGASTTTIATFSFGATPVFFKLVPAGNLYSAYYSAAGNAWTLLGSTTVNLGGSRIGCHTIASTQSGVLASAVISNFTARTDGVITVTDAGNVAGASHTYTVIARDTVPNSAVASTPVTATTLSSTAGVKVGANKKLNSTADGTDVFLIGVFAGGFQVGQFHNGSPPIWNGLAAPTSANWASFLTNQQNALASGGKPYAAVNILRIPLNTACLMAFTGIDPFSNSGAAGNEYRSVGTDANGRTLYCGGTAGGGPGTGVGQEATGDPTAYRTALTQLCNNFLGAGAILGRPMYIMLDMHWTCPVWTGMNQILMPTEQAAALSPADVLALQWLASQYGSDPRYIIELHNEMYGTSFQVNANAAGTEPKYLGNGNGNSNASFPFPTIATSPNGTGGGYRMNFSTAVMGGNQTCTTVSLEQALKAYRAAGGTNAVAVGCTFATSALPSWNACGGTMSVTDPYTVSGVEQKFFAYHAYNGGSATTANMDALAAVAPFVCTEYGQIAQGALHGSGVVSGSSYQRYKNNYSGFITCGVPANWNNNANVWLDDGHPFASSWTMQSAAGTTIFYNTNISNGNTGNDTSQIPTGSN